MNGCGYGYGLTVTLFFTLLSFVVLIVRTKTENTRVYELESALVNVRHYLENECDKRYGIWEDHISIILGDRE